MPEEQTDAEKIAELEALFDMRWNCDMRAIKRWQEATGRTLTWPDHTDLLVWLLEQLEAAESALSIAGALSGNTKFSSLR